MSEQEEEEFVSEEEEGNGVHTLKKLRDRLAEAVKEKQEYLEGWQRSRADFANFKREEALMNSQKDERIRAQVAEAIIPTLDSFELAFKDKAFAGADEGLKKGLEALQQGLLKSLEQIGIVRYSPLGERFDPNRHEALREVETTDVALDHTIENVHATGYSVGDRVIRPAQVSVYSHKA